MMLPSEVGRRGRVFIAALILGHAFLGTGFLLAVQESEDRAKARWPHVNGTIVAFERVRTRKTRGDFPVVLFRQRPEEGGQLERAIAWDFPWPRDAAASGRWIGRNVYVRYSPESSRDIDVEGWRGDEAPKVFVWLLPPLAGVFLSWLALRRPYRREP